MIHREAHAVLRFCHLIGSLVVLQCLKGVELLHTAITCLHIDLQGIDILASDGKGRQQGEGNEKTQYFLHSYFFVVMRMTPFLAFSPYLSTASLSFSTSIRSMVLGSILLMFSKGYSLPSTYTKGFWYVSEP